MAKPWADTTLSGARARRGAEGRCRAQGGARDDQRTARPDAERSAGAERLPRRGVRGAGFGAGAPRVRAVARTTSAVVGVS